MDTYIKKKTVFHICFISKYFIEHRFQQQTMTKGRASASPLSTFPIYVATFRNQQHNYDVSQLFDTQ
jgi:hypothetical protein